MNYQKQIIYNAEEITWLAHQAKVLSSIILEDESTSSKTYTLTYFTDYLLDKILNLSESIIKDSFDIAG